MGKFDYARDTMIDPDALDVEWLAQASLARRYAANVAKLNKRVAEIEEELKVLKAELTRVVNKDPERYTHKKKPNASDIEAYYRTRREYRNLKQAWIQAKYEAEYAALAHSEIAFTRKKALEKLVDLYIANYFAAPKGSNRMLSKEWERRQKDQDVNERIGKSMKRSKNNDDVPF